MDKRERNPHLEETLRMLFQGMQTRLWTIMPGIVQSFNPDAMTVEVQIAINGRVVNEDGTESFVQMPLLLDCPVKWPGGGVLPP